MLGRMYTSLGNLKRTLELLLETVNPPAILSTDVKAQVENNINASSETCKRLEDELKKFKEEHPSPGVPSKPRGYVRRVLYPFKQATLAKIQVVIAEAQSNLLSGM